MTKREPINNYTVVQHSGYGYAGDVQFIGGLESSPIYTRRELQKVEKAGGLLLDNYCVAEDFCDWAMYTASDVIGLIPQARRVGHFSHIEVDKLRVFVPLPGIFESYKNDPKVAALKELRQ